MKEFDWENAWGSPQRVLWLRANHDKNISLDEYIAANKALRPYTTTKRWSQTGRRNYQTARATNQYHYLKETFGFFV